MKQWLRQVRHARNKESVGSKLLRLFYYRLIIPIKRARDQPEIIARGVAIGILMGMTPTVGLQMYLIFLIWLAVRRFWRFNLVLAIAWSWISNPATMLPMYYMFHLTGKMLLLDFGDHTSFDAFTAQLDTLMAANGGNALYALLDLIENLWNTFGWSIVIGCVPYSLGFSFLGYWLTYRLVEKPNDIDAPLSPED
ncbi:MAG: DUF2062 domain-containing protein [Alphaproteobacteria bacterium]|nr:DUF2062 domain-containing protein [Rhodospirillales bacterium]MCW9045672.1 DUF2062 domain-containing protein [Alphaproteobacteria bacterium]